MEILASIISVLGVISFGIMLGRDDITFAAAVVGSLLWVAIVVVCAILGSYVTLLIALLIVSLGVISVAIANELR